MQLSFIFLLVVYTSMCAGLFCHERSDLRVQTSLTLILRMGQWQLIIQHASEMRLF